jgi:hypothetical protein
MEAFTEKQNFLKNWWFIMAPVLLVVIGVPMLAGFKGKSDIPELLITVAFTIPVFLLLLFLSLHSRIDETGVVMKFNLQLKPFKVNWSDVKSIELGTYSALFDYGGWGYRRGWSGKRRAYNVSGNIGLKLVLNDDRIVLLGTRKRDKMQHYLQYIKDKYQIAALNDLPKA